jgi:hypothetical protein
MPQIVPRTCSDLHPVFILADAANAREEDSIFPMLQPMANAPIFSDRDGPFGIWDCGVARSSPSRKEGSRARRGTRRYRNTNYRIFNTQIGLARGPFRPGLASIVLDFIEVCRAHSLLVSATGVRRELRSFAH